MIVTLALIVLCVVVSLAALSNAKLFQALILNPYRTYRGEKIYTVVTSGIIHADYSHLFFNMFTLFYFGSFMEEFYDQTTSYGVFLYLGLFTVGIILSDIPTIFKHKDHPGYYSLGASGGVAAIMFASILAEPSTKVGIIFFPVAIPGYLYAVLYMGYSYYMSKQANSGINHDAHLSGALFGLFYHTLIDHSAWSRLMEYISTTNPFE